MNNYPNFKNFNYTDMYNTSNNPFNNMFPDMNNDFNVLNIQNNNMVKENNELYNPYNGFIRGNMFKDLYDPYKKGEPYEVKPANEQAKLLTDIDALCFAMIDLNLLLDVNPDNKNMINLFNQYREKKERLTKEYENEYGPITTDSDSLNSYPWAWNDMPWPWDN